MKKGLKTAFDSHRCKTKLHRKATNTQKRFQKPTPMTSQASFSRFFEDPCFRAMPHSFCCILWFYKKPDLKTKPRKTEPGPCSSLKTVDCIFFAKMFHSGIPEKGRVDTPISKFFFPLWVLRCTRAPLWNPLWSPSMLLYRCWYRFVSVWVPPGLSEDRFL